MQDLYYFIFYGNCANFLTIMQFLKGTKPSPKRGKIAANSEQTDIKLLKSSRDKWKTHENVTANRKEQHIYSRVGMNKYSLTIISSVQHGTNTNTVKRV